MKKKLLNHFIFIVILSFFIFIYLCYINIVSYNIPFMDYWRTILRTIKMMEQKVPIMQIIWESDFGQRNPLIIGGVILNIKYAHLNCKISEYISVIPMSISCILIYKRWVKNISGNKITFIYQTVFSILLMFSLFNLNQWEILHIQFAFPFMARICIYILIFYLADQAIVDNNYEKRLLLSGALAMLAICGLSQLYFVALILSAWIVFFIYCIISRRRKETISYKYILIWMGLSIGGVLIYFYNNNMASSGAGNIRDFIELIFNGQLVIGILSMFAAIILPQTFLENINAIYVYIIGLIFLGVLVFCIFKYFQKKLYKNTYLPIFFILYGGINMGIIAYGRLGEYGAFYLTSSRYVVETTLILCGMIFIIATLLATSDKKIGNIIIHWSCILWVATCMVFSFYNECNIAKSRYAYKENLGGIIKNIDYASDEDLMGLQSKPQYIRELTDILKENNLSLFYDDDVELKRRIEFLYGIGNDSWVEEVGALKVRSGEQGIIKIAGYNPNIGEMNDPSCEVYINDIKYGEMILDKEFEYEIKTEKNQIIEIRFATKGAIQAPKPDVRKLAFIILNIKIE